MTREIISIENDAPTDAEGGSFVPRKDVNRNDDTGTFPQDSAEKW